MTRCNGILLRKNTAVHIDTLSVMALFSGDDKYTASEPTSSPRGKEPVAELADWNLSKKPSGSPSAGSVVRQALPSTRWFWLKLDRVHWPEYHAVPILLPMIVSSHSCQILWHNTLHCSRYLVYQQCLKYLWWITRACHVLSGHLAQPQNAPFRFMPISSSKNASSISSIGFRPIHQHYWPRHQDVQLY